MSKMVGINKKFTIFFLGSLDKLLMMWYNTMHRSKTPMRELSVGDSSLDFYTIG